MEKPIPLIASLSLIVSKSSVNFGRSKDIINQGGFKIYPGELENLVKEMGLPDCAVVGVPNGYIGEEAVLCAVRTPESELTAAAILASCRERFGTHKSPTSVLFFDDLPRSRIGKVRTGELRNMVAALRAKVRDTETVRRLRTLLPGQRKSFLQSKLRDVVARVLNCDSADVSVEDDATFGSMAMDSIGAVEMTNALGDLFGRPVSATVAFDYPTVGALCDHLLRELFFAPANSPPREAEKQPEDGRSGCDRGDRLQTAG